MHWRRAFKAVGRTLISRYDHRRLNCVYRVRLDTSVCWCTNNVETLLRRPLDRYPEFEVGTKMAGKTADGSCGCLDCMVGRGGGGGVEAP